MTRVIPDADVSTEPGSELALTQRDLPASGLLAIEDADRDTLLFVARGSGVLELDGVPYTLAGGVAAFVAAGERVTVTAETDGLTLVQGAVAPYVDRHAAMGERATVSALDQGERSSATGRRSFHVLFGPHNGSTRATFFAGLIPPGCAPWHYHLYDEIVWIRDGHGRLHLEGTTEDLGPGAAFRLHPREVHIVENTGSTEMAVLGLFTPAGSPSAAYLPAGSSETYETAETNGPSQ